MLKPSSIELDDIEIMKILVRFNTLQFTRVKKEIKILLILIKSEKRKRKRCIFKIFLLNFNTQKLLKYFQ